jgi:hypothetical protein
VAALSMWAAVSHDSGRRHSPKALELERVTSFLVQVLQRTEESPGQTQREIAERFSNEQIYQLAMTCRDWANGDTADPIGTLEDMDTLQFCFFESLKVLKSRGAKVQLRHLFLDARVNDGWRLLWYETLGEDWLAKNPFVMPETDPQLLPEP